MATTLEEIAKMSGVSTSTVSRVLNNHPRVSAETRDRIWEIIRREGYRPNLAARGLALGRTDVVAAVIPVGIELVTADPYYAVLLGGIAAAADARDRFVMLSLADPSFRHNVDEVARQGVIDGAIFSASRIDDPLAGSLLKTGVPFVSIGRSNDGRISYVDVDNRGSARQATAHLLRLGHQRIATIAGPSHATASADRLDGYRDALEAFGVPVREQLIFEGDFTEASGRSGVRNLLEHRPDAVFIASDRMAAGAMNEIHRGGLRVPEDLALVGFDDAPLAREMDPPLTTIRQPIRGLGEAAVAMLLDLIDDPKGPPRRVILPTELIVRASCGSTLETERKE